MNIIKNIFLFYYNGFKNLTSTSRKLWLLIWIKSAIILIVLFLFFPRYFNQFETENQKSDAVSENILNIK